MIKVRHSKTRRMVLLDFGGEIGVGDVHDAVQEVGKALGDIGDGYTLVEVFRDKPHFTIAAAREAGNLAGACDSGSGIWMVVRVEGDDHCDPGMTILHRTRWKREVPEVRIGSVGQALALAAEEVREQDGCAIARAA
jgi:hypothetical protein